MARSGRLAWSGHSVLSKAASSRRLGTVYSGRWELAVFLVFEGVQRALQAIGVLVATLDAWLVHYC